MQHKGSHFIVMVHESSSSSGYAAILIAVNYSFYSLRGALFRAAARLALSRKAGEGN
jgi:hypothetical protein